jgi:tetratricopeptide (TPR) repeat protein
MVASLAGATAGAQAGRGPSTPPLVQQVRVALGHGDVLAARRLAESPNAPAEARAHAAALVDLFEGRIDSARTLLEPLASRNPLGDAALELAWLEHGVGQRDVARRLFDPIAAVRTFSSADDYYRLARAAPGIGEFLLANDAYKRIADLDRADVQTDWGDVFYLRHQPGDAVLNYRKAIEIDRAWVRAYVGLARALAEEDPDEARAAFETAEKLAPNHPDVIGLAAERHIEREDWPAARGALDRLAKVRPNTVTEWALRAVIAYATSQSAEMDAALARVRQVNPMSAEGYRLVAEKAAHKYQVDEAATLAQKAVTADPESAAAHRDLGLYLLRTGEEAEARKVLDRAWDLDRSSQLALNLLTMLDSLEKFEVVSSGDLVFKFAPDQAAVLKAYAVPLGEEAYRTFVARYGFTPAGPILVEVFPRHDDFAVRTLGLPGLVGALGACFGRVVSMDSPTARPPGDFSWQATLWHELAHVFTLQMTKYRVPRWLTEGISVFEEHRRRPAWGRELTLEFAHLLARGRTFGVKGLPGAFRRPETLALAYFEASLVVEHLVEVNGDAGLRTLLAAYADGATDVDAFGRAFGRSVDEVEASFKAFVTARYGALAAAMADPPNEVAADDLPGLRARAEAAPKSFVSQLAAGQALFKSGDLAAARPYLERAVPLAPQATGAGSPRALLSAIAEKEGDLTRARRELRMLLVDDHTNIDAARRLVALAAGANALDDEDAGLRLVADLDPFDAEVHGKLGRRELAKGNFAAALVEYQAALALGPPNVAEARADVAEVLLKLGRREEARREALLALKEAPTFARAQDLLLAAMGKIE